MAENISLQRSNCISFGLTDIVALFANEARFFRFRVLFRAWSLLNEVGDPPFFYISDITNSSTLSGKSLRKKSMLENFRANALKFEDHPSFFSLSGCSATVHLLDHRHFHILDVVVVGQIEVIGHGNTSSMIAGIMMVSLHRPKVLTKTVRKFTAGFSNVQHMTSLAKDRIDHAGGSTIEAP